ncbi:hypothetical protein [Moorena sp. SIO4G3]|uniref:hypothetical protein n=1 Tax=Moorena sp. SIO4G3 TaxID=2607821 RepID=UPI00142CC91A|nr:hypothetical protein [Moorena sp. SIO4G3]NEO81810.1 hypothetical protein [Moorena sp. SIO4G3]
MGRWGDGEILTTVPDSQIRCSLLPTPCSLLPTPYSLCSIMTNRRKNNYQYHAGLVSSLRNF